MEAFSSKDMAMKAQKKILSHMASKSMAHMFIDDNSSEVLDELYRVSKEHSGNRAEAQKVVKNMIKIAVKVGVLFRHEKFSADELSLAQDFRKKLHHGAMTAISFQEVQHTHIHNVCVIIRELWSISALKSSLTTASEPLKILRVHRHFTPDRKRLLRTP